MKVLSLFTVFGLAAGALVLKEPALPKEWQAAGVPLSNQEMKAVIVLKKKNMDVLESLALEISDPASSKYGKHLTQSEVRKIVGADASVLGQFDAWFKEHGVSSKVGPTGDMIFVNGKASGMGKLFGTQVYQVAHNTTQQGSLRAGDVHMPEKLAGQVTTVLGVHGLPLPKRSSPKAPNVIPYKVTPTVLEQFYGINAKANRGSNSQAVAEFQGQYMSTTDLKTFFKEYVPTAQAGDDVVSKFVGKEVEGEGVEALLDIQYMMGVAPGLKSEFWEFPSYQFCGDLVEWSQTIINSTARPSVHSVSYGWQGDLSKIGCTATDVNTVDSEFVKLATMGVTILFSSGDSGSGLTGDKLWSSWPASSPWVTAVGATRFLTNTPGEEMATDQFGSGGGFYDMFPQPQWQRSAVANYFTNETAAGLPPTSYYNKNARGTPDVSVLGEGYQVIVRGSPQSIGGTSASCPAFGGMISLINDARLAAGKSTLGFLNQFLYANPQVFRDTTHGNNKIDRSGQKVAYGWDAVTGWDPATGLGTPYFQKLMDAAMNLP